MTLTYCNRETMCQEESCDDVDDTRGDILLKRLVCVLPVVDGCTHLQINITCVKNNIFYLI